MEIWLKEEWNSLAIATLCAEALTPILVLVLGLPIARRVRRAEALQQANRSVVDRRVAIFSKIAVKLNRVLCFATFVGRWKEYKPADVLRMKREIDEAVYANRLLFSDQLFRASPDFMATLFVMYATVDRDALIRARIWTALGDRRNLDWWDPSMTAMFATDRACDPREAQSAYEKLAAAFRQDLYVTDLSRPII